MSLPGRIPRDQNRVPVLAGVSTVDGETPTPLEVNPITGALLVEGGGGTQGGTYPDSEILFDDDFSKGFCGWEKLHEASNGAFNVGMNNPLTLSNHGTFGTHSLMLQTNDVAASTYGSQAFAIKRWTMQNQAVTNRIVDFEVWFSYGSDNNNDGLSGNSGGAPKSILFGIDTQAPGTSSTALQLGQRCYFIAFWRQFNEFAAPPQRSADWFLNTASTIPYGQPGYISPDDGNFSPTQYITDFPFNGNKRNVNYLKFTVDIVTQKYLQIIGNDKVLDLTTGLAGAIAAPTSPSDPLFNDPGFNGGLNFLVAVNNRTTTSTTASFVEIHRTRATWR